MSPEQLTVAAEGNWLSFTGTGAQAGALCCLGLTYRMLTGSLEEQCAAACVKGRLRQVYG